MIRNVSLFWISNYDNLLKNHYISIFFERMIIIMEFENVIKERYSVRSFKETEIEQDKLDRILEAGRIAPTAVNAQPQRVFVIKSEEGHQKLRDVCKMTYEAPVVLLICADIEKSWKIKMDDNFDSAEMDAAIAGTQMMLEAWNLGIGSCWIRAFNSNDIKEAFKLPTGIQPMFILCIGYKASDAKPNERMHFKRKTIEETTTFI